MRDIFKICLILYACVFRHYLQFTTLIMEKLKEKLKIEKIYYFLYNSKEFDDLVCMEK